MSELSIKVPLTDTKTGKADKSNKKRRWASMRSQLVRRIQGLIFPLALVILWEGSVRVGLIGAHLLPPPSELIDSLFELHESGVLLGHIAISSLRVFAGFLIGAVLALIVGAVVGLSKRAEAFLDPTFQAVRAIPSLAWVPLLLIWLGVDEAPKITLIAIGTFFPVYLNFVSGIHNVDRKWVEVGNLYGFSKIQLVTRIFLPASIPPLFTGFRTGLSLAWMFLVAAELIAATQGVGYLLTDGRETGRTDLVIVSIIILALLGKLSDSFLQWLERRLLFWQDSFDNHQQ